MRPSSSETIRSCAADLWSSPGVAGGRWSAPPPMKRDDLGCGPPWRRFHAERLCPDAVFVPPDFTRYRAVSQAVREIFLRHTNLVEPLSLDEAYLDVTENKTGLPTATRVARIIRQQILEELNLTASAGVAPNKFLAKIASDWRKPNGLFVIQPAEIEAFLTPLPIGRLPGVGKVTEKRLETLGVRTVGDLRHLDLQALERQFGRYGVRVHQLAHGIDDTAVVPKPADAVGLRRRHLRARRSVAGGGANDTQACGKGLGRVAQRIARGPHSRPQAEDRRVQRAYAKPYPLSHRRPPVRS